PGLRHFFDLYSAFIDPAFHNKLRMIADKIFPGLDKFLHIQHISSHDVDIHVQWRGVVLIFQSSTYKNGACSVTSFYAIHQVTTPLYHPLIDELFKRLLDLHVPSVFQKLVPEATIEKVSRSVFGSSDIQIDVFPIG